MDVASRQHVRPRDCDNDNLGARGKRIRQEQNEIVFQPQPVRPSAEELYHQPDEDNQNILMEGVPDVWNNNAAEAVDVNFMLSRKDESDEDSFNSNYF